MKILGGNIMKLDSNLHSLVLCTFNLFVWWYIVDKERFLDDSILE